MAILRIIASSEISVLDFKKEMKLQGCNLGQFSTVSVSDGLIEFRESFQCCVVHVENP